MIFENRISNSYLKVDIGPFSERVWRRGRVWRRLLLKIKIVTCGTEIQRSRLSTIIAEQAQIIQFVVLKLNQIL